MLAIRRRALTSAAALWLVLPAAAQQVRFAATVAFGDSLTHNDLLGLPFRRSLYGADPMEAVFRKGASSGDRLSSYAIAGSKSQHVTAQIGVYAVRLALRMQPLATTISYEIGGNDILSNFDLLAAGPPGRNAAADREMNLLLRNIAEHLTLLYIFHPRATFVVWTIPDVTWTPRRWSDRNTTRGANVRSHVARINDLIRALDVVPNIVVLDTAGLIRQAAAAPPIVRGRPLVAAPAYGKHDHVFADRIHPTAVSNAVLANVVIATMNTKWRLSISAYSDGELAALARR